MRYLTLADKPAARCFALHKKGGVRAAPHMVQGGCDQESSREILCSELIEPCVGG